MRKTVFVSLVAVALMGGLTARAQDHAPMDHQKHMAAKAGDGRQLVDFPPEMREHTLRNMREHLQALADILTAMSNAQYAKAGKIAEARLGMESPSAEGCKNERAAGAARPAMSEPAGMDHRMSEFMPEAMRKAGFDMHNAASVFALEAGKAAKTGKTKPALAALSRLSQQCTACHAAFRMQ